MCACVCASVRDGLAELSPSKRTRCKMFAPLTSLLFECDMFIALAVLQFTRTYVYTCMQEYGVTKEEKLNMAEIICNPLLRKIQSDLSHVLSNEISDINHRLDPRLSKHIVITPSRHVRTRLYFTSESHIHCMINILRYGGLFGVRTTLYTQCTCTPMQLCISVHVDYML